MDKFGKKELIAFDLYGTCLDRNQIQSETTSKIGEILSKEGNFEHIGRKIRKNQLIKEIDLDHVSLDVFNENCEVNFNEKQFEEYKKMIAEDLKSVKLFDETIEVLKYLKSKGHKIAVISNLGKAYEKPLNELFPEGIFDYKILSYKVGYTKPNPKIFENLREISGENFDNIVLIGDSWISDIRGANGVGIKPIFLDRKSEGKKIIERQGIKVIQISELGYLKEIF